MQGRRCGSGLQGQPRSRNLRQRAPAVRSRTAELAQQASDATKVQDKTTKKWLLWLPSVGAALPVQFYFRGSTACHARIRTLLAAPERRHGQEQALHHAHAFATRARFRAVLS